MSFDFDKSTEYFVDGGVNVMAFSDFYPEGHQSGVSLIMHGHRIATNGDIRFEQTPGQWQPVPKQNNRTIKGSDKAIITELAYPDESKHKKGFNPMLYPDFKFNYKVSVMAEGSNIRVKVDMDRPVKDEFIGKLCFNLELFPGILFDKSYIMDDKAGVFPRQPNGPLMSQRTNYKYIGKFEENPELKMFPVDDSQYNPIIADDLIAEPYAVGKKLTVCPEDDYLRFTIESKTSELKLYDGRMNHNNGWFVVSSEIPADKTEAVVEWIISPNVIEDFIGEPVIQVSQVGYHPAQEKRAVIELDSNDKLPKSAHICKITSNGKEIIRDLSLQDYGNFLRYRYLIGDFSDITEEGLYCIQYGHNVSSIFKISKDIYERGVWQPVVEYYLPVQMCHMRVNEKYRVWHGACHMDDGVMAPTNLQNFDGYPQYGSTYCKCKPGKRIHGVNCGGWHDAGDFDLRVESQSTESFNLAMAYTEFGAYVDATTVNQKKHLVEIHEPDGKNDILQQLEHGVLAVVAPYRELGRLARGIICKDLRQYVLLGDPAAMTDGEKSNDDRMIFTEDNPIRELQVAAHLAASASALKGFNDELSEEALTIAKSLYKNTDIDHDFVVPPIFDVQLDESMRRAMAIGAKIHASVELYLATGKSKYLEYIIDQKDFLKESVQYYGWIVARLKSNSKKVKSSYVSEELFEYLRPAFEAEYKRIVEKGKETPYGIPYTPYIWGAGWGIQRFGMQYYYLMKAYPDIFDEKYLFDSLNFVLGCHPGSNTASFASGVGTKSVLSAYCAYRQDWSYIPGGVVSGTALIRPDFPELLEFPFLWQQTEYVAGEGSTVYMLLVLSARKILMEKDK